MKRISPYEAVVGLLFAFVLWCRADRGMADYYATRLYPVISCVMSRVSSLVPFSLEEFLVVVMICVIILIVVAGVRRKERWHCVLWREVKWLALIYVWFYIGWGLNYSRSSLSQRLDTPAARYDADSFKAFLSDYARKINSSFDYKDDEPADVEEDIRTFYSALPSIAGLCRPHSWQAPKTALASGLFSKVGVSGSMGPFLSESLLNGDMPEVDYPFTAAHEFAHLMGVSSEAEANFWAFRFSEYSPHQAVRYSGYLSLLGNIMRNAHNLLPEEDYRQFIGSIRSEVIQEYNDNLAYWSGKYSKRLGKIQNILYNAYLKGNGIKSGTKNYDEVVSLLMTDFPL